MKYLYTLTSTPNDNYYEQFLLSITSLKLKMPNAEIVLLCDSRTKETLTGKRSEYEKLVSSIIATDAPPSFTQIEISRWIKTSMRRLVDGDFLFIDCDTIITDDLSSVEEENIVFGACLDKHSLIDRHGKSYQIIETEKQLGFNSYISNQHFNSGVIYCKDTRETRHIFDKWHELWLYCKSKKILRDQPSFNMAARENMSVFTELSGIWNCQIAYNGLPYLSNSKIIHYFATDLTFNESPFLLAANDIFKHIKNTGHLPEVAFELLKNPKGAFVQESQIIAGNDILFVLNSNFFQFIFLLRKKIPHLFNILDKISSIFKKQAKKHIIKSNKNIYN